MAEVNVFHETGSRRTMIEQIDASHLLLVGCVNVEWGRNDSEYPLPVFLFDDDDPFIQITDSDRSVNRVNGLRPTYSDYSGGDLLTGAWEAIIDLPQDVRFGKGSVTTTTRQTDGHIFEKPLPYLVDHKLAYVREADNQPVVMEYVIGDETYNLVYAPAEVLEKLGRLAIR